MVASSRNRYFEWRRPTDYRLILAFLFRINLLRRWNCGLWKILDRKEPGDCQGMPLGDCILWQIGEFIAETILINVSSFPANRNVCNFRWLSLHISRRNMQFIRCNSCEHYVWFYHRRTRLRNWIFSNLIDITRTMYTTSSKRIFFTSFYLAWILIFLSD